MASRSTRTRNRPRRKVVDKKPVREPSIEGVLDVILDTGKWFDVPWRSGRHAAESVYHYFRLTGQTSALLTELHNRLWREQPYSSIETLHDDVSVLRTSLHESAFTGINEYIRIVQLFVSHSDGGGHAYNELLKTLGDSLPVILEPAFMAGVRWGRCYDAIGTIENLCNDGFDEVRRAFTMLWERGHHRAIYALPHKGAA